MPAITALPTAPARTDDPTVFITRADAMMAALPTFVTETNAAAVAMNLNSTTGVSTTSLLIGTGSKSLTVETGKSFLVGMSVKIAYTASPTNWMHGDVTAYTTGTGVLVVNVTTILGSGTQTAWTVSLSGPGIGTSTSNTFVGAQIGGVTALTSTAASIAINLVTNNNFTHTTTENTTLAAPSSAVSGQSGVIVITQGATPRTLAYNAFWKFTAGVVPTLTATASAVDTFAYYVESATRATCQLIKDVK